MRISFFFIHEMQSSLQQLRELVGRIPEKMHVRAIEALADLMNSETTTPSDKNEGPTECEIARLKQEVRILQQEKKRLTKKISELNLETESNRLKTQELQKRLKEDYNSLLEKAQQDNMNLSHLLEISRKENEMLRISEEDLSKKLAEYLESLRAVECYAEELKRENQHLRKLVNNQNMSNETPKAAAERESNSKIVDELKQNIRDFEYRIQTFKSDNMELHNKVIQLKQMNEQLTFQNDTIMNQKKRIKSTYEDLVKKNLELTEELKNASKKIEKLEKDRHYEKTQLEKERDSVMKLLENFAADNERNQEILNIEITERKNLAAKKVELEKEISKLSSAKENLELTIEEFKQKMDELELKLTLQESGYELLA